MLNFLGLVRFEPYLKGHGELTSLSRNVSQFSGAEKHDETLIRENVTDTMFSSLGLVMKDAAQIYPVWSDYLYMYRYLCQLRTIWWSKLLIKFYLHSF